MRTPVRQLAYLHVGLDHFFSMFPHEWRDHPRQPGPGFWVETTYDDDGSPRARIRHGEAGTQLLTGMEAAVNALLAAGNNVILDEMPIGDWVVPAWRRDLRATRTVWVRLTAPLPVLEERERRPHPGSAAGQLARPRRRARGRRLGPRRRHRAPRTPRGGRASLRHSAPPSEVRGHLGSSSPHSASGRVAPPALTRPVRPPARARHRTGVAGHGASRSSPCVRSRRSGFTLRHTLPAHAARLGLSRAEYIRRRLTADAAVSSDGVSREDLRIFWDTFGGLADPEVMAAAWR